MTQAGTVPPDQQVQALRPVHFTIFSETPYGGRRCIGHVLPRDRIDNSRFGRRLNIIDSPTQPDTKFKRRRFAKVGLSWQRQRALDTPPSQVVRTQPSHAVDRTAAFQIAAPEADWRNPTDRGNFTLRRFQVPDRQDIRPAPPRPSKTHAARTPPSSAASPKTPMASGMKPTPRTSLAPARLIAA